MPMRSKDDGAIRRMLRWLGGCPRAEVLECPFAPDDPATHELPPITDEVSGIYLEVERLTEALERGDVTIAFPAVDESLLTAIIDHRE